MRAGDAEVHVATILGGCQARITADTESGGKAERIPETQTQSQSPSSAGITLKSAARLQGSGVRANKFPLSYHLRQFKFQSVTHLHPRRRQQADSKLHHKVHRSHIREILS